MIALLPYLCITLALFSGCVQSQEYNDYGSDGDKFGNTVKVFWTNDISWCPLGIAPIPLDSWYPVSRDRMIASMAKAVHMFPGAKKFDSVYVSTIIAPKYRHFRPQKISIIFRVVYNGEGAWSIFDYAGTINVCDSRFSVAPMLTMLGNVYPEPRI